MLLHKLCNYISKKSSVIILTPYASGIGDCAEEIYFGLLKARREGKKLLMLFPRELPWKPLFGLCNRELFNVDSPYRWRSDDCLTASLGGWALTMIYAPVILAYRYQDKLSRRLPRYSQGGLTAVFDRWALTLLYAPFRAIHWILVRFFVRVVPGSYPASAMGKETLWQPDGEMKDFSWDIVESYHWSRQYNDPLPVTLHKNSLPKAERLRLEMGLPKDAWFACLHIREGGFYNDQMRAAFRNASIKNYGKGIRAVTDSGGWVVRMGDKTMTPLPAMPRVIDYPHSRFKSELMDIYLMSQCRFFIGMISGILEIAVLFQKPIILTNMPCWFTYPPRKGDLGITKHIYSHSRSRFLSLQEILREGWGCQFFVNPIDEDYVMEENSAEEIHDVIAEFLDHDKNASCSELQMEFNRRRNIAARKLLLQPITKFDHFWDVLARFQVSAWLSGEGTLGRRFLEQNWQKSARNGQSAAR